MKTIYRTMLPSHSMIKSGVFLLFLWMCFSGLSASAQRVNKDSLSLAVKIRSDREKLTRLQNSLPNVRKEKEQAEKQAQMSADDNQNAANRLSNDPEDKKLARKSASKAGDAKKDAKNARKAADRLEDLNKEIRNLTESIGKYQTKLNKYVETEKAFRDATKTMAAKGYGFKS